MISAASLTAVTICCYWYTTRYPSLVLIMVKVLCPTWHKVGHFGDVPHSWLGMEKLNLSTHSPIKRNVLQHKINTKKLKPGLVASYDIRPGNGERLFWFRRFINLSLTYLLGYLPTYLQPRDPHGARHPSFHMHSSSGNRSFLLVVQVWNCLPSSL